MLSYKREGFTTFSFHERGFTLIELLIVIGVVAILLTITLLALNPYEEFIHTQDVSSRAVAHDVITASIDYYTSEKALPFNKDDSCKAELSAGETLAEMPSCVHDLINDGKLEEKYSSQLKDIHVTKCGSSAVLCYSPKSKTEYKDNETIYNKYGVNQPGCPGNGGPSEDCYWCKPILNDPECLISPTPTPTSVIPTITSAPTSTSGPIQSPTPPTPSPTIVPTITPIPTVTPVPTTTPIPTLTPLPPTPTPTPDLNTIYGVGGYKLDDTKFFQTYAVLAFTYPAFAPNYMIDISFRPDFGGTTSSSFGYFVNGVPVTSDADTIFNVAYTGDGNFGTLSSPSYAAQVGLTPKHFGFISMPYYWSKYANGCGKPIYWRLVGWPGDSTGLIGPTYTNTVDCVTKVGVVSAWEDMNHDGVVDWTDYIIQSLDTNLRAGGWQPPE